MPPRQHALLSASSAHRWLKCTPSAVLEEEFEDSTSEAAEEGTAAHALCEYKIQKFLNPSAKINRPTSSYDSEEMEKHSDDYVAFISERIEEAKSYCDDPKVLIEQRLDFSCYVPEGFGTGDCLIVADKVLEIIDFKYGMGVVVDSFENPQMMLYALGALNIFDCLYDIEKVRMTIFQPRRENISSWEIDVDELKAWAEQVLKVKAELAFKGEGDYAPGPHCIFCKAKTKCRKRAELSLEMAKEDFKRPPLLSDDEVEEMLPKLDELMKWANDLIAYAQESAINHGKQWTGYKLVESKTNRKYADENKVAEVCLRNGYEDIYKKSLLSITNMEKYLGKKTFNEILGGLVYKPPGHPTLVPVSDKRPEILINDAKTDFMEEK